MPTSIPVSTLEKFTTFGDFLRFLRRRAGITQTELSIQVGYSTAQISRLEQNLRLPDLPTIEARFVPALGIEDEPKAVARLLDLAANVRREDAPGLGLCPYKGLNYFDETDTELFAGREALTAKLAKRVISLTSSGEVNNERFLAIVGASGSGKSSLVRAGLVPSLRWNPVSANWPIYVFTPTARPLESLAASLTKDIDSMVATAALMDDLGREPRSLNLFIKRVLKPAGATHLLLLVDQFEELFNLCRTEEERTAFIDNLLTAASEDGGLAVILIAIRADFYAYCASYPRLREALARQQEYIGAMSDEELRRAIEEPARRGRWEFEPGLVDLLLHDVGREPGALPLLSHALFETWQRRRGRTMTLGGYAASGGVRGAIAETAEAVFADQFSQEQQAIARRIFLRLTELGDETTTGDTRRRATFNELILKPEEADATQSVLKALADARLITTGEDSAEVAHEALIREWPKLRGWLEDNREGLRLHRHLTESAKEWAMLNREPDGLYRGARLAQACEWAATHMDEMNALEHEFLKTSSDWAEHEAAERELQRRRELEAAQKLAEVEKQRAGAERQRAEEQAHAARQLRRRALYLAGALVIALGMVFVALFFGAQARQSASVAQNQQRVAFSRELAAASISNLEVDPERSILLALEAVSVTYSIDRTWTAEAEDSLRRALLASRLQLTLRGHSDIVASVAFSPDGKCLATASNDGKAIVWDAATGEALLTLTTNAYGGEDHGMAFSPDGKRLATASNLGTAKVWDALTGQELLTLDGHSKRVSGVDFSPDGKRLATSSEDGTAKVWDAATGEEILTLRGHANKVWFVDFSPDGTRLATASDDKRAKVWDAATGVELLTVVDKDGLNGVVFSPDGKRLATAGASGNGIVWDAVTGEKLLTFTGHNGAFLWRIAYSPDGKRLATSSFDGKVKVWDAETGQELFGLSAHTDRVHWVVFSPDGKRLATASKDGTAKVWNASLSRELLALDIQAASSRAFSPDGTRLATGYADGGLKLWSISSAPGTGEMGNELLSWYAHARVVNQIAFSPDGARLLTVGEDRTVRLWDLVTGKELLKLRASGVTAVVFSPDGKRFATGGDGGTVRLWDSRSGEALLSRFESNRQITDLAFSPDGAYLAVSSIDLKANVLDLAGTKNVSENLEFSATPNTDAVTPKRLHTLLGHVSAIWGITFSPDGTRIATASHDRTAKVWDAATGEELLTLTGHDNLLYDIAFSPDGKIIATSAYDGTVKLWDSQTGQELKTLYGHTDAVVSVAVSEDGRRLLTASKSTVRLYLLRIQDLVSLARTRVTRTLTVAECQQFLHLYRGRCEEQFAH